MLSGLSLGEVRQRLTFHSVLSSCSNLLLILPLPLLSAGVRSSVNWGALAFLVSSYAKFSTCQYARKAEAERMRIVIEEFNRKKSKNTTNSSSIQEPQAGKSS